MGPGKRNEGDQSMHQSFDLGEQASSSWRNSENQRIYWEKEGRGEGPKGHKDALASSPPVKSGFPEVQALGRNSHPPTVWLPSHLHSNKSSSLMQKCNLPSLLGTGVAKSEAFSKNLKSRFD